MALLGDEPQKLFDSRGEFGRQKLVGFVHDHCNTLFEIEHLLSREIRNTPGCAHHDMNSFVQSNDVVFQASATGCDHDIDAEEFPQRLAHLRGLQRKLSRRYENQGLRLRVLRIDLFQCGNEECSGFSRAVLCSSKYVSACKGDGYSLFLDG